MWGDFLLENSEESSIILRIAPIKTIAVYLNGVSHEE